MNKKLQNWIRSHHDTVEDIVGIGMFSLIIIALFVGQELAVATCITGVVLAIGANVTA